MSNKDKLSDKDKPSEKPPVTVFNRKLEELSKRRVSGNGFVGGMIRSDKIETKKEVSGGKDKTVVK